MKKINLKKLLAYIAAILFFIAAFRSGRSTYAGMGCVVLLSTTLIKEKEK